MYSPNLKAFVVCTEVTETPGGAGQKNIRGAGLSIIRYSGPYRFKYRF